MPDREAFLAAIAAAPDDDLPRLVFADWLDEHGDPERAAFIRLQVAISREPGSSDDMVDRAGSLIDRYWSNWFEPVLLSLSGSSGGPLGPFGWTRIGDGSWHKLMRDGGRQVSGGAHPSQLVVERGFLRAVALTCGSDPTGVGFAEAFRWEPIDSLAVTLPNDSRHWAALTDPALRRVNQLRVYLQCDESARHTAGLTPLFGDPHLAGVRDLTIQVSGSHQPGEWAREFAASPLAYRLDVLDVQLNDDGMRHFARSTRLQPREFRLSWWGESEGWRHMRTVDWAVGVERLRVRDRWGQGDTGLPQLALANWRKLTELDVSQCGITDAGLRALARATFIPRLEVLDLSSNPLFDGESVDGLHELAAALNPGCLRLLNLMNTGLGGVPDFLATRFGDRVVT